MYCYVILIVCQSGMVQLQGVIVVCLSRCVDALLLVGAVAPSLLLYECCYHTAVVPYVSDLVLPCVGGYRGRVFSKTKSKGCRPPHWVERAVREEGAPVR